MSKDGRLNDNGCLVIFIILLLWSWLVGSGLQALVETLVKH